MTVIGNTADDITLHGLRVCPDLDTVMYTLGGGIHPGQGWGRDDEHFTVAEELAGYGAGPDLVHPRRPRPRDARRAHAPARPGDVPEPGDGDPVRTLATRRPTAAHERRPGRDPRRDRRSGRTDAARDDGPTRAVHFQEWWVRLHAAVPARQILAVGIDQAKPAPGVLEAIREADVVLLPPSNPVVSIGTILGVPGVRDALRGTRAPVVGCLPHHRRRPRARNGRRLPDGDRCRDLRGGGGGAVRRLPRRLARRDATSPTPASDTDLAEARRTREPCPWSAAGRCS